MLEIKNVSVRLKSSKKYIVKNVNLYIEDGKLVSKGVDKKAKEFLFGLATNQEDYEIKIGSIVFNGKKLRKKEINKTLREKLLDSINELANEKENGSISNYVCSRLFKSSKSGFGSLDTKLVSMKEHEGTEIGLYTKEQLKKRDSIVSNQKVVVIDNKETIFGDNQLKIVCRPLNSSGFTLVELLATISILAILALIAVPNVVGVTQRNKQKTYVEDAKKLISLAEYKVNSNSKYKPSGNEGICLTMDDLGSTNFATGAGEAPNGGKYDTSRSYVRVTKAQNEDESWSIKYAVQLAELKDGKYFGINDTEKKDLYDKGLSQLVVDNESANEFTACEGVSESVGTGSGQGGSSTGEDNTPSYSDVVYLQNANEGRLDFTRVYNDERNSFGSTGGGSLDSWFTENCKNIANSTKTTTYRIGVYSMRGEDFCSTYPQNFGVTIGTDPSAASIITAKATPYTDSEGNHYYEVNIPLSCSNTKLAGATGNVWLQVKESTIFGTGWTDPNKNEAINIGTKNVTW